MCVVSWLAVLGLLPADSEEGQHCTASADRQCCSCCPAGHPQLAGNALEHCVLCRQPMLKGVGHQQAGTAATAACRKPEGQGMAQAITDAVNNILPGASVTQEQVMDLIDQGGSDGGSQVCSGHCPTAVPVEHRALAALCCMGTNELAWHCWPAPHIGLVSGTCMPMS